MTMAHLPSYKSFTFHEVEEIEKRAFSSKFIPSSTTQNTDACGSHFSIDEAIIHDIGQKNISDSVVIHLNKHFFDEDNRFAESETELNAEYGKQVHVKIKKKKRTVDADPKVMAPMELLDSNEQLGIWQRMWQGFIDFCTCSK